MSTSPGLSIDTIKFLGGRLPAPFCLETETQAFVESVRRAPRVGGPLGPFCNSVSASPGPSFDTLNSVGSGMLAPFSVDNVIFAAAAETSTQD